MTTKALIVGAGPVGLTMAIELARYGVPIRIVDKCDARTDKSKALVIWSRPLELLNRAGCSEALISSGYKIDSVRISTGEKEIGCLHFEGVDTQYPYALMIPQNETERVLEEFLNGLGVHVERNVEMTSFTQDEHRVMAHLHDRNGKEESVETPWLIGCDGAHSTVRHQLRMEFRGDTSPIDWILADVHLENTPRKPQIRLVWHTDGVLAIFPIAEDRYRIIADAGDAPADGTRPADPTLSDVQ